MCEKVLMVREEGDPERGKKAVQAIPTSQQTALRQLNTKSHEIWRYLVQHVSIHTDIYAFTPTVQHAHTHTHLMLPLLMAIVSH